MFKRLSLGLFIIFLSAVFYGCASRGIEMRTYSEDKPRVDQATTQGNAGYLMGDPQYPSEPSKKTRRVYVVEFSKTLPEEAIVEEASMPKKSSSYDYSDVEEESSTSTRKLDLSQWDRKEAATPMTSTGGFIEYKIEKDDTLQKIAKKFYDSYGKWTKIYEANKDKIKDPNNIKPGLTIKIPQE